MQLYCTSRFWNALLRFLLASFLMCVLTEPASREEGMFVMRQFLFVGNLGFTCSVVPD